MKKLLTILFATLMLLTAVSFVGCGSDKDKDDKSGLLIKKFNGDNYYTVYGYVGNDQTATLNIGEYNKDGVTIGRIKANAFQGDSTLTEVIVPSTVETIDEGAFNDMRKLQKITVPFVGANKNADAYFGQTVKSANKAVDAKRTIGYIFGTKESEYSASVTNDYGVTESADANGQTASAPTYYIPATLREITVNAESDYAIPMYAFNGLTQIAKVNLTGKIVAIGENAFGNFTTLKEINIPKTVKTIYKDAFNGATALAKITFESGTSLTEIGESAFVGTAITSLTANVKKVGRYAFANVKLTTLVLYNVEDLGAYSFYGLDGGDMQEIYTDSGSTTLSNDILELAIGTYLN